MPSNGPITALERSQRITVARCAAYEKTSLHAKTLQCNALARAFATAIEVLRDPSLEPLVRFDCALQLIGAIGKYVTEPATGAQATAPMPTSRVAAIVAEISGATDRVFTGPAIIEEWNSTTIVHPGQHLEVDAYGNLTISQESVS